MQRRTVAIILSLLAVAAVFGLAIWIWARNAGGPGPAESPTASSSPAAGPTVPSPSSAVDDAAPVTCESTSTVEFQAQMAQNGWIPWETQDAQIGARPFDLFPGGAPEGQIICRWGESPDVATDTVIDLAWAPLDGDQTLAAQEVLVDAGYVREESVDGAWLTAPGEPGGDAYLFTGADVRWAITRELAAHVKAPEEER